MEKASFIFYASFFEALRELPDKSRLKIYDAICEYALRGNEIELKGIEKAVFSLVKPQLLANKKRYENGLKGGRGKKQTETEEEPNGSQNKTKVKPNRNQTESKPKPNENENENVITPPLYSPPTVGENTKKEIFCEKYPKYRKSVMESNVSDIDFGLLISEFEKSTYLQKMYTFKQVLEVYPSIIKGEFRDGKTSDVDERNAKVERERFYAERKQRSMSVADKYLQLARKNNRFKAISSELAKLEIAIAKAEMYAPSVIEDVKAQKAALIKEQEEILNTLCIQKEWLNPQPYCKKCSDTGFLRNGKACDCYDCYKKEKSK